MGKSRFALSNQYQSQMASSYKTGDKKEIILKPLPRGRKIGPQELDRIVDVPAIRLNATVYWDEKHDKVVLGCNSKFEYRLARNTYDGTITAPEYGGQFSELKPRKKQKFSSEARLCLGVALRTSKDEEGKEIEEGIKCSPYSYTGKNVLSIKHFNKNVKEEMERVKILKGPWGRVGEGYIERYGSEEKGIEEATAVVSKKYCNIADIMDHVVAESKKVYENTEYRDNFLIFHDGLKQWWAADAQQYLHDKHNMRDRQLRAYGDTNASSKYYQYKVVGDSPELCPLDNYLFADLERCKNFHVALSSFIPKHDDPRCFHLGTPMQVEKTLCRCWEVEPTSERIIADIKKIPGTIQQLIDARGTLLKNEFLRKGRRAARHQQDPHIRQRTSRLKGQEPEIQVHPSLRTLWGGIIHNPKRLESAEYMAELLNEDADADADDEHAAIIAALNDHAIDDGDDFSDDGDLEDVQPTDDDKNLDYDGDDEDEDEKQDAL